MVVFFHIYVTPLHIIHVFLIGLEGDNCIHWLRYMNPPFFERFALS